MDSLLLAQTKPSNEADVARTAWCPLCSCKDRKLHWKNALRSRCFVALCDRLNSDHLLLLYHCEIRWLSKGRVFNCLFEMRHEGYTFFNDQLSPLADHYVDDWFFAKLAYLVDIFDQLNQLNLSMQGKSSSLFLVADKIKEFKKKIDHWKKRVNNLRYETFPLLCKSIKTSPYADTFEQIIEHLSQLSHKFDSYFPEDPRPENLWTLDPFIVNSATEMWLCPWNLKMNSLNFLKTAISK